VVRRVGARPGDRSQGRLSVRILHVDKFLRRHGGAAGYMLDLAAAQRAAGHTVEFFSVQHPSNVPATFAEDFAPEVDYDDARPLHRALAVARAVHSPVAARRLATVLDRFRPDVVHAHNIYHQLSPSILGPARRRGIPVVLTAHDAKLVCPSYGLYARGGPCTACVGGSPLHAVAARCAKDSLAVSTAVALESLVHRRLGAYDPVARFVAPSRFLADLLVRGGFAADRVVHLPNPVARSRPVRRGAGDGVVSVGRLVASKGVDVTIRAVGMCSGARLTVVGDGPERASLEELAHRLAPGRVRFCGTLDPTRTAAIVAQARVAALTARAPDNQPLAVLEAKAAAVPVVVTALGGLPELVRHDVDGLVVDVPDPALVADALARALRDPAWARAAGERARRAVAAEHDPALHLTRLHAVYAAAGAGT
jgi:glycosyltransferase involved in cell wall biosynthesis